MSQDNFEWTDELVREYINKLISPLEQIGRGLSNGMSGYDTLQKFKEEKSKQSKEDRGWEVVSVLTSINHCNEMPFNEFMLKYPESFPIKSVKRLSDSEVFSIGDVIEWGSTKSFGVATYNVGDIIGFVAKENNIYAKVGNTDVHFSVWQKATKPKPLFKTTNGVDMFIGGVYWYVDERFKAYATVIDSVHDIGKGIVTFSSLSAAEDWLINNCKELSIEDILSFLEKEYGRGIISKKIVDGLGEIVKSKLNQK